MPKSTVSYHSLASDVARDDEQDALDQEEEATRNAYINTVHSRTAPGSPVRTRKHATSRTSDIDLRDRMPFRGALDESTGLLTSGLGSPRDYRTLPASTPGTPRYGLTRNTSQVGSLHGLRRHHSRRGSFGLRLARALGTDPNQTESNTPYTAKSLMTLDDRVWYDQFTSTDWVHDSIADAYRVKELRSRKDLRGRLYSFFDGAQGWVLVAIIGVITAGFAYFINITEATIFDYKEGHCTTAWWLSRRKCCAGASTCPAWRKWSASIHSKDTDSEWVDFSAFVAWVIVLSAASCLITLQTKTVISSAVSLSTLDENLGADHHHSKDTGEDHKGSITPREHFEAAARKPPVIYYPAAGSGVAEVKVILSGFVLHGYLGLTTLVCKTFALILSVGSGLSIGKEGPYVHIATCVGNITARLFTKYSTNDGKRREVLSAAAAAGVAVAFGAPIGGVLFSLEEVSYYFPPKTLFRTFFCCIVAALSLRFLDPYGTGKIVLFEVRYVIDWKIFEVIAFVLLGVLGGFLGAMFIKASRLWAKTFRRITVIRRYPIFEVFLVAVATGLVGFWNRYTRLPVAELLFELSSPCDAFTDTGIGLCPTEDRIPTVMWYLTIAFVIKAVLTTVTFGIKVPAGIYVPSMVVGGLMGRIVGHLVQWLTLTYPDSVLFTSCPAVDGNPESCVVPGVYALVAAGATMCGVTRLSVTLAVILFELTGSLEHVLPFSLGVLIAKWTADALEPLSIYDLLTDMNSYPYLDSKIRPVFTTDLGDITARPTRSRLIDVSNSPLVPAKQLRSKLDHLHMVGEIDGGLPIIRDGILVGLIPGPDLEYALDRLEGEEMALCLMSTHDRWQGPGRGVISGGNDDADSVVSNDGVVDETRPLMNAPNAADPTDFTPYIDPAPVSLDIGSPMDLVFECFVKLGLRYICVLREGRFAGMVHKKAFVKYVKQVEKEER